VNIVNEVKIFVKTLVAAFKEFFAKSKDKIEYVVPDHPSRIREAVPWLFMILFYISYPFKLFKHMYNGFVDVIVSETLYRFPKGRHEKALQDRIFVVGMLIIFVLVLLQPAAQGQKLFTISFLIFLICYYTIMATGLNLQTGTTGIVNFGVIFFVGIGMITSGVLSRRGLDIFGITIIMDPISAMIVGMIISGGIGYLLAYPGLKLRTDYFAIITIALGEFLKRLLLAEPTFQTKRSSTFSIGLNNIPGAFEGVFSIEYTFVLAILGVLFVIIVTFISHLLISSPYGRVLRGIREDEEVVSSYGYDIFKYKASVLAVGGAIFAMAGSLWVWKVGNVFPNTIAVIITFYVWAAFIIGGKGNPKGMILGASVIAITQYSVNNLSNISATERGSTFLGPLDVIFRFITVDIGGTIFGNSTWMNSFASEELTVIDQNFLQLLIVGFLIIVFLRYMPDGILPELPYTPKSKSEGHFEDQELLIEKMKQHTQASKDITKKSKEEKPQKEEEL